MTVHSCHLRLREDDLVESIGTQLKQEVFGSLDRLCSHHHRTSRTTELNTGHLNRWIGKLSSWYAAQHGRSDLYTELWTVSAESRSIVDFAKDLKSITKTRKISLGKYSKVREAIKEGSKGRLPGVDTVPDGYTEDWEGEEVETMLSEILEWRSQLGTGMLVKHMTNREEVAMMVSASFNQLSIA